MSGALLLICKIWDEGLTCESRQLQTAAVLRVGLDVCGIIGVDGFALPISGRRLERSYRSSFVWVGSRVAFSIEVGPKGLPAVAVVLLGRSIIRPACRADGGPAWLPKDDQHAGRQPARSAD